MSGVNIRGEMNDLELCINLVPEAGEHYRRALDVMSAYPDYAKTQFRIVVEHLTSMLAKRFRVDLAQTGLYEAINELSESQVIDHSLRSELHAVRKAGNAVVHSGEQQGSTTAGAASGSKDPGSAGDLQSAVDTRNTLIGIFESVFLIINRGEKLPAITTVAVGDFTSQQTLWKAVTTMDFEAKLAAGLILEAQSIAPINRATLIIGYSEDSHKKTTARMATELYWAACEISAGLDRFSLMEIELKGGKEACLFKLANTEALYQFGKLTYANEGEVELKRLGLKSLEVSAIRGYAPACALHGNLLREHGRHNEALAFLEVALSKGEITAFAGMAILFVEKEWECYSQMKAEQFLQGGIQRGCDHCEYLLGRWLYDGNFLDEDRKRGIQFLELAASKGHNHADMFLRFCVDNRFVKEMQRKALGLLSLLGPSPVRTKQARNDPCQCGSGSKYKKCCGA